MHGDKLEALERFDVAAQMWGWEKDQGVGNSVNEAAKEYEAAREALITALASPPVSDGHEFHATVFVSADGKDVRIEHKFDADWNTVLKVHEALRDWAIARIAGHDECPFRPDDAREPAPAGGEFFMVPREATEAMLDAAGLVDIEIYPTNVPSGLTATNRREARAIWKEMLAASPSRPSPSAEQREAALHAAVRATYPGRSLHADPIQDTERAYWNPLLDAILAASPSRPSPSPEQREVVARRLHDRFIERSKARVTYDPDDAGCYANTPWERLPMSFKRDYYADAEAVLSALCDRGE